MIKFQPVSGNSSVVEHDLAKVGVASSNLVSRSILLLLLTLSFLNATQKIILKDTYCSDDTTKITASFFTKNKNNDFFILNLPKSRSSFSVSSLQIISKFKENNISFKDMSNGIVTFKKCYDPIAFGDVKKLILKKFQEKYPSLKIKQISLSSTSPINFDLSGYKVKDIDLRENNYRNSQGVLSVIYRKKFKLKRIYLRYEILGTILVFKAKYNLRNGKILKNNDYVTTKIKFDVLPLNVLTADLNKKYIIRGYIRKGTILTSNDIRVKKSVLKNDSIQAILKDENLIIEEEAHVLSDANIGDVVKIRTLKGKILKAKILSPKSAIIIE